MKLSLLDYIIFVLFFVIVLIVTFRSSRGVTTVKQYFMASSKLSWGLIGFAMLATAVSTEQFIGLTGEGFRIGIAIASYQWLASITLVFVSLFVLPKFLRAGISTIPEYLEYRYDGTTRTILAVYMLLVYTFVSTATVTYSGAKAFEQFLGISSLTYHEIIWIIGISSCIFIYKGGLSSVVWTDLIFVIAALISGLLICIIGFYEIGGFSNFVDASAGRLVAILPADNIDMPWPSVFLGGLWVAHIFYWGFNQFTTQRAFAANSLSDGQKGMLLTASILVIYPFLIVIPGILSYELFEADITNPDDAFPVLVKNLLPMGLKGVVLASVFGGVIAGQSAMLNASSSIFTQDLYKRYINKEADDFRMVQIGRRSLLVLVVICCLYAPFLIQYSSVYKHIQEFWGFITPSVVLIFIIGLYSKYTPAIAAKTVLLMNPIVYTVSLVLFDKATFLYKIGFTFIILLSTILLIRWKMPLLEPNVIPDRRNVRFERNLLVFIWAIFIVIGVLSMYVIFL